VTWTSWYGGRSSRNNFRARHQNDSSSSFLFFFTSPSSFEPGTERFHTHNGHAFPFFFYDLSVTKSRINFFSGAAALSPFSLHVVITAWYLPAARNGGVRMWIKWSTAYKRCEGTHHARYVSMTTLLYTKVNLKKNIYLLCRERFPYFKANDDRWKNSVRHNLSISPHFRKSVKARTGTGHLWTLALPPSARTIAANLAVILFF